MMSNDMRIVKFETLIEDINDATGGGGGDSNTSLLLIYDFDKLNDYGKIIIEKSRLNLNEWYFNYGYNPVESFKDLKNKIIAAKELVRYCREKTYEAHMFIFWAMMVMAVDKTDKEEQLSLICDFARMLKISDDEMMDILQIIKVLYHEAKEDYEFRSDTVPMYFDNVLALYD